MKVMSVTSYIDNADYVKIRLSKLQKWRSGTKRLRSAKYFSYIAPFYDELYCCTVFKGSGVYAEGEDTLLYCRKADISAVFRKYYDNVPRFKNWDIWLADDLGIWSYYSACSDYEIEVFKHFENRSVDNGK